MRGNHASTPNRQQLGFSSVFGRAELVGGLLCDSMPAQIRLDATATATATATRYLLYKQVVVLLGST